MKKLFTLTLLGMIFSVSSFAQISGVLGCCVGSYSHLIDSSASSTWSWSSSNPTVATIDASSGLVYGVTAGTATISYVAGGSVTTAVFSVYPIPAPITGASSVCVGSSITLTDATPGGSWSHSGSAATVGSVTGVVTGVATGSVTVYYTVGTGCSVSRSIAVGATVAGSISGDSTLCTGTTSTLSCSPSGGAWSSSNTAVATVDAVTGVVGGVSSGIASISYTVTGACGTGSTYVDVWIMGGPGSAGTISGASTVAAGSSATLSSSTGGGVWSSSNTAVATVSASGHVYGVSAGTATISYTVTSCGTSVSATSVITVTAAVPANRISGYIHFGSALVDSMSPIKVWLITYDATSHLLQAVDSMTTYSGGTTAYYYFMGEPTADYRVKAAIFPTTFSSTGYTPTYHTSSAYWGTANVINHTGGVDDGEDITMGYGTVTSGPGFIGGDVTMGANRGTSDGAPVVGMQIYAQSSTGAIVQCAYTDAAGHYSFANLPVGSYTIYPEAINYATTALTSVNITAGAPVMSAANFVQHTLSHTITPVSEGVNSVKSYVSTVTAFPNPTSGKMNIQWQESTTETATVTVADITGKEIFSTSIKMNEGTGVSQLDLSSLINGIYMVSIKSGTINYNSKVQVIR